MTKKGINSALKVTMSTSNTILTAPKIQVQIRISGFFLQLSKRRQFSDQRTFHLTLGGADSTGARNIECPLDS